MSSGDTLADKNEFGQITGGQMNIIKAGVALFAAALIFSISTPGAALARPGQAELIMDARSGEVLHQKNADTKLHPASLTKMMTLYLVFEAIERGKLDVDQRVRVSRAAAAQPPSKVGFRAGQNVRIRDLIRAAAVRSANDSAVVLAEAVAGSEAAFARLMTQRARDLGMDSTTFKNASGLTGSGHLSTARDMAVMGYRLFHDFPEYYNLFGRESTPAFGRTVWNTNRLLGDYRGADGIKTGYTRAAGFNLVASAERGSKRVIAVYFGGSSSQARNAHVAKLLDRGFALSPETPRRAPRLAPAPSLLVAARAAPAPSPRPGSTATETGSASLLARGAEALGEALAPAAAQAAETPAFDTPRRVALVAPTALAPTGSPAPTPRAGSATAAVADGDWTLTLGAFARREAAVANLAAAALGALPQLAQAGREIDVATGASGSLFRAKLTGLDRATADAACMMLIREGKPCQEVAPAR